MRWLGLGIWILAAATAPAQTQSQLPGDSQSGSGLGSTPGAIRISPTPAESSKDNRGWLPPGTDPQNTIGWPLAKHLAFDQKAFWTNWRNLGSEDAKTVAPFAVFTGLLIAGDSWIAKQVPDRPKQLTRSNHISQWATYSLMGAAGGSFVWGRLAQEDHLREAGLLSAEALFNSTLAGYAFRVAARRERPFEDDGSGRFFQGGSSFPSEHSAAAWSVASVLAHEYPGPLTKFLAYGLASTVTITRVSSKQHFASDTVVGSALGWYLGRQVYRARHDPELGGGPWGGLRDGPHEGGRKPESMASPYVSLDSWVYPAFDRLAALGYVETGFAGLRPWTRMECARLTEEAGERIPEDGAAQDEMQRLYEDLYGEFLAEMQRIEGGKNLGITVDSIYSRVTGISGVPLRDGYHFGQTIINDFGRPYGEGLNAADGFTAHAVAGPLAISIQGEYQHAPSEPSDPPRVLQAITSADGTPVLPPARRQIDRSELMEGSIALRLNNVQLSFGKQSLWLGPSQSGALLFSDNAEPVPMLRVDSVSPYKFPLLSHFLGPVRTEFFLGQLSGHHWVLSPPHLYGPDIDPQPFIHGSKVSFKPTPNLEFGLGFTAVFGGPGLPFTWHNFLRTFYQHKANTAENPGKRFSAFDLSYHIPGLRKWLVFYTDSLVIDEYSPLGSSHPSLNPGIYLPQIAKIRKLDLRVEGVATDLPTMPAHFGVGAVYSDSRYHSGYTNNGMLLGNWIGRMGRGEQGWATYWLSSRNKLQLGYRQQDVNRDFIGGGRLQDFSARAERTLRPDLGMSAFVQHEKWRFPVLSPTRQQNLTSTIQVTWWPSWGKK